MSYCRWSNDDYSCDVYVYESDAGFITEVADRRIVWNDPTVLPPPLSEPFNIEAWLERHQAVNQLVDDESLWTWLDLPDPPRGAHHALHPTAGACADWLLELRTNGFNVPQYAVDALREEQA